MNDTRQVILSSWPPNSRVVSRRAALTQMIGGHVLSASSEYLKARESPLMSGSLAVELGGRFERTLWLTSASSD